MDKGPWWVTVHGVTELDMTEPLTLSACPSNQIWARRNAATLWLFPVTALKPVPKWSQTSQGLRGCK